MMFSENRFALFGSLLGGDRARRADLPSLDFHLPRRM
jgi:hypothetical protein